MKWLWIASAAALVLVTVPALALAQARPDFSGSWRISQAKSSGGATGNNAKVSFPSEVVIRQNPAELHVVTTFPRSDPVTAVYKLDGSEITVAISAGITEKARAMWDGDKLVIAARRVISSAFGDFVSDTKEIWSRTGNALTVQKTQSSEGLAATETAVFDKAPS